MDGNLTQLDELDLESIFSDPSIDVCWDHWKTSFLSVMDTYTSQNPHSLREECTLDD